MNKQILLEIQTKIISVNKIEINALSDQLDQAHLLLCHLEVQIDYDPIINVDDALIKCAYYSKKISKCRYMISQVLEKLEKL